MAGNANSGRRRKPSRVRELEGNPGHRPIPEEEPQFQIADDVPPPPDWIDVGAKAVWLRVAPDLHANGLLTGPGADVFANYCVLAARVRYCEEEIQKAAKIDDNSSHGGLLRKGKDGVTESKLLRIANAARRDMLRLATEFGLTPSAAAHLQGAGKRGDEDKTDKKFFGPH